MTLTLRIGSEVNVKDDGRRQTYIGTRLGCVLSPGPRGVHERYEAGDILASCVEPAEVTCVGDSLGLASGPLLRPTRSELSGCEGRPLPRSRRVADELRAIMNDGTTTGASALSLPRALPRWTTPRSPTSSTAHSTRGPARANIWRPSSPSRSSTSTQRSWRLTTSPAHEATRRPRSAPRQHGALAWARAVARTSRAAARRRGDIVALHAAAAMPTSCPRQSCPH